MDRGVAAAVRRVARVGHDLAAEPPPASAAVETRFRNTESLSEPRCRGRWRLFHRRPLKEEARVPGF